jgi:hypothetical protein
MTKLDVIDQGFKSAPAMGGAAITALTLNQMVAVATGFYIVIQALYLLRKWYREEQDYKARKAKGLAPVNEAKEADE